MSAPHRQLCPPLLLLLLLPLRPAPARAGRRQPAEPAAACAAAKLLAAGIGAKAALACHQRAAATGRAVDLGCVAAVGPRVAAAFRRAERLGGCVTTGDAGGISGRLNGQAAAAALALRPTAGRSKCATAALRSIGIGARDFLRARAKYAVRSDVKRFEASRVAARASTLRGLTGAARKPGCGVVTDAAAGVAFAERLAGLAGPLRTRLEGVKGIRVEPSARAEMLTKRTALEANGFTVADDGSLLTGSPRPLGGWQIVFGTAHGRSLAEDGIVTLDMPSAAPFEGQLHHPADDVFVAGPVFLPDLAAEGEAVPTLTFDLRNAGPCGMNASPGDDSSQCAAHAASRTSRHGRSPLNPDRQQFPPQVTRELGTYPNDAPGSGQLVCLDYDGLIESHTERGESSETGIIAYPGSTCYLQVEFGCCDNEAASIQRRATNALFGDEAFPVLACTDNHKSRLCQSVTKGDISLRVRGEILKAGATGSYEVSAGENVPITVHNNGCYAETHITDGILASFLPLGGHLTGSPLEGSKIKHYQEAALGGSSGYRPDQEIAYAAPSPCPGDEFGIARSDEYSFETDGSKVGVRFKCPTTTTTLPCLPGVRVGPGRAGTCEVPIVDWVGTSRHTFNEVGQYFAHHREMEASYTFTNDPLLRNGNGDANTFVVKSGSVTYSENNTDGPCTSTVEPTTVALTPFPGGIPSFMQLVTLPDGEIFVQAGFIEGVPVTVHVACPPNSGEQNETGAPADYLLIPVIPRYRPDGTGQTISGSYQPDGRDAYEWHMTRSERVD